jgi:hypothetical protein
MCGGQKTDLTITQTFTMETTINGLVSVLGCMQRGALGTWSMLAYNSLISAKTLNINDYNINKLYFSN